MAVNDEAVNAELARLTDTELIDRLSDDEFRAALTAEEFRRRQRDRASNGGQS